MSTNNWTRIIALALCFAFSVWAEDSHPARDGRNSKGNFGFKSGLVGSIPGATIGGVNSGGLPWVAAGEASVSGSGQLHLEVTGLLIADAPGVPPALVGTVGPLKMVAASLVCGGSGGSVAASTDGSPLSSAGDAEIDAAITLPGTCMAPVVLVRVFNSTAPAGSQLGAFIALSGFNAAAAEQ